MNSNDLSNAQLQWPDSKMFRRSIRLEFSVFMTLILCVIMALTGYFFTQRYVASVTANEVDKLLIQARSYSNPAGKLLIVSEDPDALLLSNICRKMIDDNETIFWVGITNRENRFIAHTDIKKVVAGEKLDIVNASQELTQLKENEWYSARKDTIYISVPIRENGITLGRFGVASSNQPILEAKEKSITTVLAITLFVLLIGLPLMVVILHRKLKPITTIANALRNVNLENMLIHIPFKSNNELGYLSETLRVMGYKLDQAQQDILEKERLARELEIAHEIQNNILPSGFPAGDNFDIAGVYRSAREVGGDYYDFMQFSQNRVGILIADVSGKSLPGMLVMLMTRELVKRFTKTYTEPADLLCKLNAELLKSIKKGMFVTLFFGVIDTRSGQFTFASAGHNPLLWMNSARREISAIKTKGFPLGLMPVEQFNKRIEQQSITITTNDWLVLYTDGVNEAHNTTGQEFGMDRFEAVLKEQGRGSSETLIQACLEAVDSFTGDAEQFDDITMVALKWTAQQIANGNLTSMKDSVHAG